MVEKEKRKKAIRIKWSEKEEIERNEKKNPQERKDGEEDE